MPSKTAASFNSLWRLVLVILGIFSASFGVSGFLQPSGLIDGGITGLSMLLSHLSRVPLWALVLLLNLPFVWFGLSRIGRAFALRAVLAICGFAAVLAFLQFPHVTKDPLLTAVFGGVFIGAGIGLSIRGGSVLDGTEIIALVLSRNSFISVGTVILCFNIVLFLGAGFVLGIQPAMYSILTYVSASKTMDFVLYGLNEYYGITLVSTQVDAIRAKILSEMNRGVTRFIGKSGYAEDDVEILFSVVTRLEVSRMKSIALEVDPSAFIVVQHVSDISGGTVRPRAAFAL